MRDLIYYVAISIDGFISGPDGDVSGFVTGGNGVDQYLKDLQKFDTVLMGRNTYEFGYQYGLEKGKAAYPHMMNYIFSNSHLIEPIDNNLIVHPVNIEKVKSILLQEGSPVYLCGGGIFASWLLENELITHLKIKLNPFIQGNGIPLFGSSDKLYKLELMEQDSYDHGLQIINYKLVY